MSSEVPSVRGGCIEACPKTSPASAKAMVGGPVKEGIAVHHNHVYPGPGLLVIRIQSCTLHSCGERNSRSDSLQLFQ